MICSFFCEETVITFFIITSFHLHILFRDSFYLTDMQKEVCRWQKSLY